jgi:hypothetical protein
LKYDIFEEQKLKLVPRKIYRKRQDATLSKVKRGTVQ